MILFGHSSSQINVTLVNLNPVFTLKGFFKLRRALLNGGFRIRRSVVFESTLYYD